ncbi:hypothetical protein JNUCC64_32270 [Streptomyces sp. JNUCC 64]
MLRDALIGYRDLVKLNFPRFGAALGLYSFFPVRAEGVVVMHANEPQPQPATVIYALRPDTTSAPQDQPVVDLRLSGELPPPAGSFWTNVGEDRSGVIHEETCFPTMTARPRTSRTAGSPRTCTQSADWSAR